MKGSFSADRRIEWLQTMTQETLDVLVIGGGITGAGIAWDAAKRGMRTGLIEKSDFAFGTSSRSTKLIHGGLRYLKKGEVKLVREVGREREMLHLQAPHLVIPVPMLLPIYKGGTFGYRSTSFGLFLYDRLAGVRKSERRVMHKGDSAWRLEPILKHEGFLGAGLYYEYRTDDARLTVEVLKTAVRHGAKAVNYAEAVDFLYDGPKLAGVRVKDAETGEEYDIRARKIVNATGPWVDRVRAKDHAVRGKRLLLTKGVHLVVEHRKLPVRHAAYLDVPDGRMIFVIPRDGKTYIGTTDTVYAGEPEKPRTTASDRDYLLHAVNTAFPEAGLAPEDVESMWAGLRPLILEEGKKPSDISRKDEVWVSRSGLITIAGGKLTGFRKMAEKVVDLVAEQLRKETRHAFAPCMTDKEILSGGDSGRSDTYEGHREELMRLGARKGLSPETVRYLLGLYGSNTISIYARMNGWNGFGVERFREELQAGTKSSRDRVEEQTGEVPEELAGQVSAGSGEAIEQVRVKTGVEPDEANDRTRTGPEDSVEQGPEKPPEPDPERIALAAELAYCMEEEMTVRASDFIVRRTGLLYFDRPKAERIALDVLDDMSATLGWSEARLEEERLRLAREWEIVTVAPEIEQ